MIREFLTLIGIYKIYKRWLRRQLKGGANVEHIAVIADESFYTKVKDREISSLSGKIVDLLKWCLELDVKYVTVYALSMDALQLPRREINKPIKVLETELENLLKGDILHRYRVNVKAIGKIELLPDRIKKLINSLEETTKGYNKHFLNLAVAYRGRTEVVDATRKMAEDVKLGKLNPESIDDSTLEKYLYTSHIPKQDPDLIIRASGDERLSGFLLWQSAYSELCFLDVNWPDFRKIDILRAVRIFQERKRRFGL